MTVDVFVRHSTNCTHKHDRYWKRCRCGKWLYIPGSCKPKSAKTRSWEQAEELARKIEQDHATKQKASCLRR